MKMSPRLAGTKVGSVALTNGSLRWVSDTVSRTSSAESQVEVPMHEDKFARTCTLPCTSGWREKYSETRSDVRCRPSRARNSIDSADLIQSYSSPSKVCMVSHSWNSSCQYCMKCYCMSMRSSFQERGALETIHVTPSLGTWSGETALSNNLMPMETLIS